MAAKRRHIPNVVWRNGWAHFRCRVGGRQVWRSLHTRSATEARRRAARTYAELTARLDFIKPQIELAQLTNAAFLIRNAVRESLRRTSTTVEDATGNDQRKDLIPSAVAVGTFGVSRTTLRRYVKDDKIRAYRPSAATARNAKLFYSRRELEQYFLPRKQQS